MTVSVTEQLAVELGELVAVPGPVGAEEAVAGSIVARLAGLPGTPTKDMLGNIRLVGDGPPPRVLVTAHMDQVGYMVSRVERSKALCLCLGAPQLIKGQTAHVSVIGEEREIVGAVLESLGEQGGVLRSERQDEIQVGDRVVFAGSLDVLDGGRVCGPALDDRIGCLIGVHAARTLAANLGDIAFAWTVREEAEAAGVIRVARDINPDVVIAVDITYATSDEATMESELTLGSGPVITLLDGGMVGHSWPLRAFDRAACDLGTPWQPEVVRNGMSDAGRVQGTLGIPGMALLVPIENPHSPTEIAELDDIAAVLDLLVRGVRELIQ